MRDRSDAATASAISDIDQRQAALLHVREVAEQSTQALVEALMDAIRRRTRTRSGRLPASSARRKRPCFGASASSGAGPFAGALCGGSLAWPPLDHAPM